MNHHNATASLLLFLQYEHEEWPCWDDKKVWEIFSCSGNSPGKNLGTEQAHGHTPVSSAEYLPPKFSPDYPGAFSPTAGGRVDVTES